MTVVKKNLFCALALLATAVAARAGSPITLKFDPAKPGIQIPERFLGVSMEMQYVLPDKDGKHLFSPDNKSLIAMFKTLGIKNLRVGGNTTDNPKFPVPKGKDIDDLYSFAKAADLQMIYTLRAKGADPVEDASVAKYVMDNYASQTLCFEIGNEPNVYAKTYALYHDLYQKLTAVITAEGAAPTAKFCGPNTTPARTDWAKSFAVDFAKTGHVILITQHSYPGGNSRKVTDVADARDKMLSPAWLSGYQKAHDGFAPTAAENHLPYRIEECNSFFNGGLKDASNTHAAALWALDYLYWWASHDAAGINFHTGDHVAAADETAPCWYALFWTSPTGNNVHPVGYAAKAFGLAAHGSLLPVTIDNADKLNLTAYAVLAPDKSVYLTIINKEHGPTGKPATITLAPATNFSSAQTMLLSNPSGDISSTSGELLGGQPINDDATWSGTWTKQDSPTSSIELPTATAILIKLSPQ